MAKELKEKQYLRLVDAGAQVLALWFVSSVIHNARDLIEQNVKNSPASLAFIGALLLTLFSYSQRRKLNAWNLVTLAVALTALVIWLLGLSTRTHY